MEIRGCAFTWCFEGQRRWHQRKLGSTQGRAQQRTQPHPERFTRCILGLERESVFIGLLVSNFHEANLSVPHLPFSLYPVLFRSAPLPETMFACHRHRFCHPNARRPPVTLWLHEPFQCGASCATFSLCKLIFSLFIEKDCLKLILKLF